MKKQKTKFTHYQNNKLQNKYEEYKLNKRPKPKRRALDHYRHTQRVVALKAWFTELSIAVAIALVGLTVYLTLS